MYQRMYMACRAGPDTQLALEMPVALAGIVIVIIIGCDEEEF